MLFFFYGPEASRPAKKIREIKNKFLVANPTGGGLVEFDCSDKCSTSDIVSSLGAQNLFADKKLIIIKNYFINTKADEQAELRDALDSYSGGDVIVFWDVSNPRKNAKLFVWLQKNAHTTKEYKLLEGAELTKWVIGMTQNSGGSMEVTQANQLIASVGDDLVRLEQEIAKLALYANGKPITSDMIDLLVEGRATGDMFAAIEALTSGDKSRALELLAKQIAAGDDVHQIFAMYIYQIRTVLSVANEVKNGNTDKGAIAKVTKLHPFVVSKALSVTNRMSYDQILDAHTKLVSIDQDIKVGKRDLATALELFIVNF